MSSFQQELREVLTRYKNCILADLDCNWRKAEQKSIEAITKLIERIEREARIDEHSHRTCCKHGFARNCQVASNRLAELRKDEE